MNHNQYVFLPVLFGAILAFTAAVASTSGVDAGRCGIGGNEMDTILEHNKAIIKQQLPGVAHTIQVTHFDEKQTQDLLAVLDEHTPLPANMVEEAAVANTSHMIEIQGQQTFYVFGVKGECVGGALWVRPSAMKDFVKDAVGQEG